MEYSEFGKKFQATSGILELMDDLDLALNGPEKMYMLGGGNPGRLPAVERVLRDSMASVLADGDRFERLVGIYDNPQGDGEFRADLAGLLGEVFGQDLGPEHIALTNGSQNSFFTLFNMLAGRFADGRRRRIMLPLAPEYIGYGDAGLEPDFFLARRPRIELVGEHEFKYHVDFDRLPPADEIGAYCLSRPTNPSGNVISDAELRRLAAHARSQDRFLIVDGAYGQPFPGLVFTAAEPYWDENVILTLSLSKLGMPGVRTGIVLARPDIARMIGRMNAVMNLAGPSLGPALAGPLVRDRRILQLSADVIGPYYRAKAAAAVNYFHEVMRGGPAYRLHLCEGAFFLWAWFPDLPIATRELYERLKARRCLVVPGEYYFPGLEGDDWRHKRECLRISYSQGDEDVGRGLELIAEEVRRAWNDAPRA